MHGRFRVLALAAALLASGAAGLAAATAGAASGDAAAAFSGATIEVVSPPFAFRYSAILVAFSTDVACDGACSGWLEHRVLLNSWAQPAEVPPSGLWGVIGGGIDRYEGAGILDVESRAYVDWRTPDQYVLQVATRAAGSGANWTVGAPTNFRVLRESNWDGDSISDDLEHAVCTTPTLRGSLYVGGGRCVDDYDIVGLGHAVLLGHQPLATRSDADADGFPDGMRLYATEVRLGGWWQHVGYAEPIDAPFDTWDGPQLRESTLGHDELDAQSFWCAPLPTLSAAGYEHDRDFDGIPHRLGVSIPQACLDQRDDAGLRINPHADSVARTIDVNDTHMDEAPAGDVHLLSHVVSTSFGRDDDGDGIPSGAFTWTGRVTVRPEPYGGSELAIGGAWSFATWDDDEEDPLFPWPYARVDQDRDRVPDGSEFAVCLIEDHTTWSDGWCDDTLTDYHPPALYVSGHRSPDAWSDADEDLAPDAAEALACDSLARYLLFEDACAGDDLPPLP